MLVVCAIKAGSIIEVASSHASLINLSFQTNEVQTHEIWNQAEEVSLNSFDSALTEIGGMYIEEEESKEREKSKEDEQEEDEVDAFDDEDE